MTAHDQPKLPHGRWDIYGPIHKGLRMATTDFMVRLGRADFASHAASAALLDALRAHLSLCAEHLAHEEAFIHPALERRRGDAAARLARQHVDHRLAFSALGALIDAVAQADDGGRAAKARELYLAYSAFVAADLAHMHEEETVTWPLLCALFSDQELADLEMSIIASLSPETNLAFMRLMIPAMAPQERAVLLGGVRASAPPEAFQAVIEGAARPTLPAQEFDDLTARLGLAA